MKKILRLTELKNNQKAVIHSIKGKSKIIKRLSDFGLTPMTEICLVRTSLLNGPIEISIRRTNLAIDRDIANKIFVEVR